MPREADVFTYTHQSLASATTRSVEQVRRDHKKGLFNPNKFETVVLYLARYATPKTAADVAAALLREEVRIDDPGPRKVRGAEMFAFDYPTLAKLIGYEVNTVRQHRQRGKFHAHAMETLLTYMAGHGTPELRRQIMKAIHSQD